jgi:hypothetical protein
MTLPFHVPVAIVPKVVIDVCPAYVELICISSALTVIPVPAPISNVTVPVVPPPVSPLPAVTPSISPA